MLSLKATTAITSNAPMINAQESRDKPSIFIANPPIALNELFSFYAHSEGLSTSLYMAFRATLGAS